MYKTISISNILAAKIGTYLNKGISLLIPILAVMIMFFYVHNLLKNLFYRS